MSKGISLAYINKKINKVLVYVEKVEQKVDELTEKNKTLERAIEFLKGNAKPCSFCEKEYLEDEMQKILFAGFGCWVCNDCKKKLDTVGVSVFQK